MYSLFLEDATASYVRGRFFLAHSVHEYNFWRISTVDIFSSTLQFSSDMDTLVTT